MTIFIYSSSVLRKAGRLDSRGSTMVFNFMPFPHFPSSPNLTVQCPTIGKPQINQSLKTKMGYALGLSNIDPNSHNMCDSGHYMCTLLNILTQQCKAWERGNTVIC